MVKRGKSVWRKGGRTSETAGRRVCVSSHSAADLMRVNAFDCASTQRLTLTTPPPNRFDLSAYKASTPPSRAFFTALAMECCIGSDFHLQSGEKTSVQKIRKAGLTGLALQTRCGLRLFGNGCKERWFDDE